MQNKSWHVARKVVGWLIMLYGLAYFLLDCWEYSKARTPFTITLGCIMGLYGLLLFIGGIGVIKVKNWARKLIVCLALFSIIFRLYQAHMWITVVDLNISQRFNFFFEVSIAIFVYVGIAYFFICEKIDDQFGVDKMQILKSMVGSIIALVIFVFVWVIGDLALKLFDTLRSNRTFVQDLFTTLFAPGIGAYLAMLGVDKILKTYSKNALFYCFSSILVLFTIWSLFIMVSVTKQAKFTCYDFSIQILTPIVAIMTAYFTINKLKMDS